VGPVSTWLLECVVVPDQNSSVKSEARTVPSVTIIWRRRKLKVQVKILHESVELPTEAFVNSAVVDVKIAGFAKASLIRSKRRMNPLPVKRMTLRFGDSILLRTGLAVVLPDGYYLSANVRSGMSIWHGVIAHAPVVDSKYGQEIIVPVHNATQSPVSLEVGQPVIQLLLLRNEPIERVEVDELPGSQDKEEEAETVEGDGEDNE